MARITEDELNSRCRGSALVRNGFWQKVADDGRGTFGYGGGVLTDREKIVSVGDVIVVDGLEFKVVKEVKNNSGGYRHWIELRNDDK